MLLKSCSYFFSLEGSSVKIHSTATGIIVSTLTASPLRGRSDANVLTSAVVNPQNPFQLIAATQDGRLLIWDFVNGTLLQTINVGQDIHMMCAHEALKGSVFVAAAIPGGKANGESRSLVPIINCSVVRNRQKCCCFAGVAETYRTRADCRENTYWKNPIPVRPCHLCQWRLACYDSIA
jgi:hypothetical protein